MYKLLRHFSICSAAITLLMTAGLVYGYRKTEIRHLIEATERENITLTRTLANTLVNEIQAYVEKAKEIRPDVLRRMPETSAWHNKLKRIIAGLPVLKIKIYSVEGMTVFSSEVAQIGNGA